MGLQNHKPVFKRDASGRTISERSEKIDAAVKMGNAEYRSISTAKMPDTRKTKAPDKRQ